MQIQTRRIARFSTCIALAAQVAMASWAVFADEPIAGDVDLSGRLDALDVQWVITGALGSHSDSSAEIDHSGALDARDVQLVINAPIDADADGLSDAAEVNLGTEPSRSDTDDDGAPDGYEIRNNTEPLRIDGPHYGIIFKRNYVDDYEIQLSPENYQIIEDDLFDPQYVPGTLIVEGQVFKEVGIRYKGFSSLVIAADNKLKKPFKIDFDRFVDGQHYAGVKKLNFSNGSFDDTMMREVLAYEIFGAAGTPVSRTSHVNLYLTVPGLYDRELLGIYTMVEQVDKTYLSTWFSDNDGNLYKADSNADLLWRGEDKEAYRRSYDKKTNETEDDWSDLLRLIDVLNNTPDEAFQSEIERIFNVDGFLSYLAANTVLSNMDSIAGRQTNYYLYNNPDTGLFEFLPWDLNMAFGVFGTISSNVTLDIYRPTAPEGASRLIIDRILSIPGYVSVYETRIRALLEGRFMPAVMNARIDEVYGLIREHVYASEHDLFTDEEFEEGVGESPADPADIDLRTFVSLRADSIREQLP